jgi:hypothetical protein
MSPPLRALFLAFLAWGVGSMWLTPHLPQVDLPQHAGQVALLRDMLQGQSPWSGDLRINFLTPYLLGYLSLLLLSLAMPIESAIALVYSLAYVGFVLACIGLRKQLKGDPRLDWLFLPAFFGLPWQWGFLTFLIASGIGIHLLTVSYRFVEQPSIRRALGVLALGAILLFSHGLVFLYAVPIGLVIALVSKSPDRRRHWLAALPYVALLIGFGLYKVGVLDAEMSAAAGSNDIDWGKFQNRVWSLLSSSLNRPVLAAVVAAIAYAAPWVMGLRLKRLPARIPFLWTLGMTLAYPAILWGATNFYDRFAFLLLPLYAVMFEPRPTSAVPAQGGLRRLAPTAMTLLLAAGAGLVLARETMHNRAFARETRDVDRLFARIEPQRRLLYIPIRIGDGIPLHYLHYPLWYQARHQGFVEFNFASLLPQVVRFRDFRKHIPPAFSWSSEAVDWKRFETDGYDYVVFSGEKSIDPEVLRGSVCELLPVEAVPGWMLFRSSCGNVGRPSVPSLDGAPGRRPTPGWAPLPAPARRLP